MSHVIRQRGAGALAAAFLTLLALVFNAQAQPIHTPEARVALVIGNARYAQPLANPVRDARAVAEALRKLGFEVIERRDLGRDAMLQALLEFEDRLAGKSAVALFYYAGHGLQLDGDSQLIPVDAELTGPRDVRFSGLAVDRVIRSMARARPKSSIVILDACRDSPFTTSLPGARRGLAGLTGAAPTAMMIQYATAPGMTADDGADATGHSPFTGALLKNIAAPGVDIHEVFRRVRLDVEARSDRSGQRQQPWESSSLTQPLVLNPTAAAMRSADSSRQLAATEQPPAGRDTGGAPGTAAGRILLRLLAQTTTPGERLRKMREFAEAGYGNDGLLPAEVIAALGDLRDDRRLHALGYLSGGIDSLDAEQLAGLLKGMSAIHRSVAMDIVRGKVELAKPAAGSVSGKLLFKLLEESTSALDRVQTIMFFAIGNHGRDKLLSAEAVLALADLRELDREKALSTLVDVMNPPDSTVLPRLLEGTTKMARYMALHAISRILVPDSISPEAVAAAIEGMEPGLGLTVLLPSMTKPLSAAQALALAGRPGSLDHKMNWPKLAPLISAK